MRFQLEQKKMQSLGLVVLVCLFGGIAVAEQASFAGRLSKQVELIVFGGGGFLMLLIYSSFRRPVIWSTPRYLTGIV